MKLFSRAGTASLAALMALSTGIACKRTNDSSSAVDTESRASAVTLNALSRSGWTATASSTAGSDTPSKALDGNQSTRWSSGTNQVSGQFFTVDMKATFAFTQITLDAGGSNNDYPRGFQVFVSADGTSWGSAIASGSGSGPLVTVTFAAQMARYIKVALTSSGTFWWSIHELNVYGPPVISDLQPLPRTGWIATGSPTGSGTTASAALDANTTTRWTTGAAQTSTGGQFFQIDMLTPQLFRQIILDTTASSNDYPRGYQVLVSSDGTTWSPSVATGTGSTITTINVPWQIARFIKIVQTASNSNWWSIHEMNVLGVGPPKLSRSGWIATASLTCQNDVPSNAIDGNSTSRWSTGVPQADNNQWFQLDMRAPQTFSQIVIDSDGSSGDYPRQYKIMVSDDGSTFTGPIATGAGTGRLVTIAFAPRTARYIKIFQIGTSSSWWSIHELNVFGPLPMEGCGSLKFPGSDLASEQNVFVEATLAQSGGAISSTPGTQTFSSPALFTMPATLSVTEGNLGNQTVSVVLTAASGTITCTYEGRASTATPSDPDDVALGRVATLRDCGDACPLVGGSLFVTGVTMTVLAADPSQTRTTVTLNLPAEKGPTAPVTPIADDDPLFRAHADTEIVPEPDADGERIPEHPPVNTPRMLEADLTTNPLEAGYVDTLDPNVVVLE